MSDRVPSNLEQVLTELDVKIGSVEGNEIWGLCPKHRERTGKPDRKPTNWSVNRESGDHYCFACGYRGSLVSLVMDLKFRNDVFRARRWLARFGVEFDAEIPQWTPARDRTPKLAGVPFGEAWLEQFDPPPTAALDKRGISREAAEHFGILWDRKRTGWVLPIRCPRTGALWGWQIKTKHYTRNRTPIPDEEGQHKGTPKSRTLFGYQQFRRGDLAVLVESPLDCAVLWSNGISGGLSSYGVGVSNTQMELIVGLTNDVILALDNDPEGRVKTRDLLQRYRRRLFLRALSYDHCPDAKDVGEMDHAEIVRAMRDSRHSVDLVSVRRQARA